MEVHKMDLLKQRPVCWDEHKTDAMMATDNIDKVSCVDCLRRLAKDAAKEKK